MDHVSYSELRQNLARCMDRVVADRAPLLVTRQGAEPVVMIAASEFAGWQETIHLLSNPSNAEHLRRSIAQAEGGDLVPFDPDGA